MANVIVGKEGGGGGGAWADLPADVYDAVLESYEENPRGISQYNDDPDAMRLTLNFRLTGELDAEGNSITMKHWVNKVLSPKANLAPILDALGIPWGPGVPTDLDDMPGKPCRLVVGRKTPEGKTEEIAFVQSVVPAKAVTPDAPKRTAPAVAGGSVDLCCIPNCGRPVGRYDTNGVPFCQQHEAAAG